MEKLKVKIINKKYGKINKPAKHGDAGYDVFATKDIILKPHERYNMPLGIALEFPSDYVCVVNQKSGLANKYGIDTIGNVIDSGYRGEIHALIVNTSNKDIFIKAGQKIAQLLFLFWKEFNILYVDELTETDRGSNGFGSTGK
ncbi:dUTP diphosphatase [Patescibacteria group bacterium]|nr:dUTP diphosphatase [Patescibacteria group bacterium]